MVFGTTNGEILGWNGLNYDNERVSLVKKIVRARFDALLRGEMIADDLKVFVKQEPHKIKKIQEGRLRLISAVSLVDTMIDRILFGWLGRKVLDTAGRTPCLVGWSPVRGGWIQLNDRFRGIPVVCIDKEAWDWTVPEYLVKMWKTFLVALPTDSAPWWEKMVDARLDLLFKEPMFQFEDGTRVKQETVGIMKSGCYLTIILNSLSQSMLHYLTNARLGLPMAENQPYTIGDDTVQESFPQLREYVDEMEKLGPVLKGAKVQHFVEFAGFAFDGKTCWPAYWQKHLFNMAHAEYLSETLRSYQYLYVHEPVMYEFVVRVAREVDPDSVLPRMVALDIMDNSV
uniref:RNA-directed RNA polymerase C-terminal domain-containing protein n=1 Tax=Solemoviridae sp. TaxID=2715208 RepID=A0A6M3YPM5_9VIRU|nr:MAG: hypothetical protein 2 [Solemoviridae sp.]